MSRRRNPTSPDLAVRVVIQMPGSLYARVRAHAPFRISKLCCDAARREVERIEAANPKPEE